MTVYVRDDEWFEVGNWVYKNWDIINGVSFLPYDGGKYKLAPYEEIDARTYERLIKKLPIIDYTQLSRYELEDNTQGKGEFACVGDKCEI
jgi:ribonucleoside-diphosphate reductase alpha chain